MTLFLTNMFTLLLMLCSILCYSLLFTICSYKNTVYDCQKTYFTQRTPIITAAVTKALMELKEKHRNDYSVLFRSSCLFVMKVCQDEAMCFYYFFSKPSEQLRYFIPCMFISFSIKLYF